MGGNNVVSPRAETEAQQLPRFLQAIDSVETLLQANPSLTESYFADRSGLRDRAQMFDFIVAGSGELVGDRTKFKQQAASNLRRSLTSYTGPEEVVQIYQDLYGAEIDQLIGPEEAEG